MKSSKSTPSEPLSILVPAFNEVALIGDCLSAILGAVAYARQGGNAQQMELLVVDNASTDATAAIADGYRVRAAAQGLVLRVIHEPRKGLTRARQSGHEAATGGITAWVDADTTMPLNWIVKMLATFESDPSIVCVSGPYVYRDLHWGKRLMVLAYWWLIAAPSYRLTRYMAVGGNFAVRRAAVDRIGGFDTSIVFFGEDTNLARRMAGIGKVVFDLGLVMPTSARRLRHEGFGRTAVRYASNFLAEVVLKRPLQTPYRDIR